LLLQCYPLGKAPTPCPSALLLRTDVVRAVGGFEESFRGPYQLYEDQAFLAKIFLTRPVYVSEASWDRYRLHDRQCISVVTGAGKYDAVRSYYLAWFSAYLDREGLGNGPLKRALRKARRPYRHPRLHALMKRLSGGA
jgi:hypothetical protein